MCHFILSTFKIFMTAMTAIYSHENTRIRLKFNEDENLRRLCYWVFIIEFRVYLQSITSWTRNKLKEYGKI